MAAEFKKRHDAIWPELADAIRTAGISDYSISLDGETGTLFAVQKVAKDNIAADLRNLPVLHGWWESMVPLMEVNPDHSPGLNELTGERLGRVVFAARFDPLLLSTGWVGLPGPGLARPRLSPQRMACAAAGNGACSAREPPDPAANRTT